MFIMFIGHWRMKRNKVSWEKLESGKKCQIYKAEFNIYKAENLGL